MIPQFTNPFRPGAGHAPPYLAGRAPERQGFEQLLQQDTILENLILTGLRGVGKTVLLETFKPLALERGWQWVGTDMSEAASLTEDRIATRLLTDLAILTSPLVVAEAATRGIGFGALEGRAEIRLDYQVLKSVYQETPGLCSDKLKAVLELVWEALSPTGARGIVFAYDEAQNLADHADKDEYPLSLLLDVFQSLQRKQIPALLVLTGLPTLFPKLVEARTYSERMFHVSFLDRLSEQDSRDAIVKPTAKSSIKFSPESVDTVIKEADGYPYFIQFICREVYDVFMRHAGKGKVSVPVDGIIRKLDADFFTGRWAKATDRQRDLLFVCAKVETENGEFAVQDIAAKSDNLLDRGFSPSHASQIVAKLCDVGLIYKNRRGRYSFAVPLLGKFILRQQP